MRKRTPKPLSLNRETLLQLDRTGLKAAAAAGTLTYEGSCGATLCPCVSDRCPPGDE